MPVRRNAIIFSFEFRVFKGQGSESRDRFFYGQGGPGFQFLSFSVPSEGGVMGEKGEQVNSPLWHYDSG